MSILRQRVVGRKLLVIFIKELMGPLGSFCNE